MKTSEAVRAICEKLSEVYDGNFPCICGDNPLADELNPEEQKKLTEILSALDLLKDS